jgi:hypothetical protein
MTEKIFGSFVMFLMPGRYTYCMALASEHRTIGFMEEIQSYGRDLKNTYLDAWKGNDTLAKVTGAGMAGLSAVLEGPDRLYAAAVGQRLENPNGILGRTRRDIGQLLQNVVTLHPLRALGDAWRLGTSDLLLDGADAITGHRIAK